MAVQEVNVRVPSSKLGNADICLDVNHGGAKLGTLQLSKGSIEWLPGKSSKSGYRLKWKQLAELIEANTKVVRNISKRK